MPVIRRPVFLYLFRWFISDLLSAVYLNIVYFNFFGLTLNCTRCSKYCLSLSLSLSLSIFAAISYTSSLHAFYYTPYAQQFHQICKPNRLCFCPSTDMTPSLHSQSKMPSSIMCIISLHQLALFQINVLSVLER